MFSFVSNFKKGLFFKIKKLKKKKFNFKKILTSSFTKLFLNINSLKLYFNLKIIHFFIIIYFFFL